MRNLQEIKSNKESKYDKIIEYFSQDNGYWLNNDKWDSAEILFIGKKVSNMRYIDFSNIANDNLKNEIKYFFLYKYKEKLLTSKGVLRLNYALKYFSTFLYWNIFVRIR